MPASDPNVVYRRPWTNQRRNANGSMTMTVKRACNGCGLPIGDMDVRDSDSAIYGLPLPDVRDECPYCTPNPTARDLWITKAWKTLGNADLSRDDVARLYDDMIVPALGITT